MLFFFVFAVTALLGGLVQINSIWIYGPFKGGEVVAAVTSAAQPDWYMGWLDYLHDGGLQRYVGWIRIFAHRDDHGNGHGHTNGNGHFDPSAAESSVITGPAEGKASPGNEVAIRPNRQPVKMPVVLGRMGSTDAEPVQSSTGLVRPVDDCT